MSADDLAITIAQFSASLSFGLAALSEDGPPRKWLPSAVLVGCFVMLCAAAFWLVLRARAMPGSGLLTVLDRQSVFSLVDAIAYGVAATVFVSRLSKKKNTGEEFFLPMLSAAVAAASLVYVGAFLLQLSVGPIFREATLFGNRVLIFGAFSYVFVTLATHVRGSLPIQQ